MSIERLQALVSLLQQEVSAASVRVDTVRTAHWQQGVTYATDKLAAVIAEMQREPQPPLPPPPNESGVPGVAAPSRQPGLAGTEDRDSLSIDRQFEAMATDDGYRQEALALNEEERQAVIAHHQPDEDNLTVTGIKVRTSGPTIKQQPAPPADLVERLGNAVATAVDVAPVEGLQIAVHRIVRQYILPIIESYVAEREAELRKAAEEAADFLKHVGHSTNFSTNDCARHEHDLRAALRKQAGVEA